MATLVSRAQLAIAARRPIADDDAFATYILEAASGLVCDTAEHPEWEEDVANAPRPAKRICLEVARRSYTNPDFEIAYGLGPLSGRSLDIAALGLNLSEAEEAVLVNLQGGPEASGGGLWVQPLGGGLEQIDTVFVAQAGAPQADMIPYLDPSELDAMTPPED